ncbi:unnamed protein product [Blepharisma stoltei]|uniref:Uncharacterized protein n=1 Tax=Blepharisma stoltei TaxID=1481888 RepID=A0AAU9JLV6_9CILI|nr:unnamed protein product [Blepharisma stoltei]
MGADGSVCSCSERASNGLTSQSLSKFHFTDGCVKVVDYTGMFPAVHSLQELKHKMLDYLPYELQCIKDIDIDPVHSFVRVIGIQTNSKAWSEIMIEIIFASIGRFAIGIWPSWKTREGQPKVTGTIEFLYRFRENAKYIGGFHLFLDWLDRHKYNPFEVLDDDEENVGRVVYSIFKSMEIKEDGSEKSSY